MLTALAILAAWLIASIPLAIIIGQFLEDRFRKMASPRPVDFSNPEHAARIAMAGE